MARLGQPTKLTPAVEERIAQGIQLGMPRRLIAGFARIAPDTIKDWLNRGQAEAAAGKNTLYTRFVKRVEGAEADFAARALAEITKAGADQTRVCPETVHVKGLCETCGTPWEKSKKCKGAIEIPGQWTSNAWLLERRLANDFALRNKVEVEVAISGDDLVLLMKELAHVVVAHVTEQSQLDRITAGWADIAARRGVGIDKAETKRIAIAAVAATHIPTDADAAADPIA